MKRDNGITLALFSTMLSRSGRFCTGYLHRSSQSHLVSSKAFSAPSLIMPLHRLPGQSFHTSTIGIRKRDVVTFSTLSARGCPLDFEIGPYNAAEIIVSETDCDEEEFLDKLDRSIDFWRSNDYTSAWVSVPTRHARLIEHLSTTEHSSNFGFDLHHTNSTLQTIVMKKWLKDGTEDKIPPFATHQVGCAGFVLNDMNEILVIREWSGPLSSRTPTKQWKLPGGLLDVGESFEEATCREVLEETGVPCEFESILTFWHRHGLKFGKSDLYYVCLLRPKSLEIDFCPVEVSAARWMPIDEFLETQDHPLIRHVLKESFGVDGSRSVLNLERISPNAEMQTGGVQWPGRSPYPTYTSTSRK